MRTLSFPLDRLRIAFPALLLVSCGGKVIFETSNATGAGGASSTLSVAHGSSGFATSGTTHVATGVTTGSIMTAVAASVAASTGSGPPPPPNSCLNFGFNGIGAKCGQEGVDCAVPFACCGGHALCKNGFWQATGAVCGQACLLCGPPDFGCQIGAVCVIDGPGFGAPSYQCFKDPCPPGQLTCTCAKGVCEQNFLSCQMTSQTTVHCDCPNCGG